MSATAIQALPNQTLLYQNRSSLFTFQNLSTDVDMISLFPEHLGIPFAEFAGSAVLPQSHPWSVQMTALASEAKATGKPLMVQIVLTRDAIVGRAVNQGGALVVQAGWSAACSDLTSPAYATLDTSYVNYAAWVAKTFSPVYMVIMVEANSHYAHCGGDTPSWRRLVDIERRTYDAVKAVDPAIIAFPSFNLEDLYSQTINGFDGTQYAALSGLKRDRLGLASYPYGLPVGNNFVNPYQLPLDYLVRVQNRNPAEPRIVITETGWNSAGLSVLSQGRCYGSFVYSQPSFQAAYLELLLYSAYVGRFDHVSWWSDRDLIPSNVMSGCMPPSPSPFAECNGEPWCRVINAWRGNNVGWSPGFAEVAFKSFGTLGLRQYDGTANPLAMALWRRFLALPVSSAN